MKRALAILVGAAIVCAVAYLSWLNPAAVEFHLSPARSVEAPLAALIVFAAVGGALLVVAAGLIQAGRRALVRRRQRRTERIDEWEDRGAQLVWDGDAQPGRALLQKAWRRRPQSPRAILALAASFRETGELQRARVLLAEAARAPKATPDVLLVLADAHHAAGDDVACVEVLERLRALQPRAPRVLRALRDRYVEARRWADAAMLQEALLVELRDPDCAGREREYLTALRHQAGISLSEARARVQALEALADRRGVSVPIAVSLGDALLAVGRRDEASVVWERALRTVPRTVLVERLSGIATEPRHRERLRALLQRLRSDQVQADNMRLLSAELHLADGNAPEAAALLEATHNPGDAPALLHTLWGDVYCRRGQLELAVSAYARAGGRGRSYRCSVCQRTVSEWTGWCPACGSWDSYRSDVEIGVIG